jgi:prevent-host-death family protein
MMRTIGVRELKTHLGAVLRRVREHQEPYAVTYRGRVVARLVPETAAPETAGLDTWWEELDQLAGEIGRRWPEGVSAAQAVNQDRDRLG